MSTTPEQKHIGMADLCVAMQKRGWVLSEVIKESQDEDLSPGYRFSKDNEHWRIDLNQPTGVVSHYINGGVTTEDFNIQYLYELITSDPVPPIKNLPPVVPLPTKDTLERWLVHNGWYLAGTSYFNSHHTKEKWHGLFRPYICIGERTPCGRMCRAYFKDNLNIATGDFDVFYAFLSTVIKLIPPPEFDFADYLIQHGWLVDDSNQSILGNGALWVHLGNNTLCDDCETFTPDKDNADRLIELAELAKEIR